MHETIQFHDIAGLVRGAHDGEGLGNQFLGNIRETDAILHVVRAHDDAQVVHPEGRVDPLADVETIETELLYADLEQAERRLERVAKQAKSGDKEAVAEERWLGEVLDALRAGRGVRTVAPPEAAPGAEVRLSALTSKPVLYVANVAEGEPLEPPPELVEHARERGARAAAVSARLDAELSELDDGRGDRHARGARGGGVGARDGDPRVVRAARPDLVLHRRPGQGGARPRDPARHSRPPGRRRGAHGHGARLRRRRGDPVGGARAGRRLRRRPRAGAARASRGATT